jgi:membrane protease YdiL (CAAX protease family)
MFLIFEFVGGMILGATAVLLPTFRVWSHTGAGHFCFAVVYSTLNILTALYFSRVQTVKEFLQAFGLEHPPSPATWFAIVAALGLRVIGHVIVVSGWSKGATSLSISGYTHTFGPERYLYLAPAFMAPFFEEVYIRGFLYRAFRGSYSVWLSTVLILAFTAYTHRTMVFVSWAAALDIGAMTLLQCALRERVGNLWDCILCHLVFNITAAFGRFVFR